MTGYYRITDRGVDVCAWCITETQEDYLIEIHGEEKVNHIICGQCRRDELPGTPSRGALLAPWIVIFATGLLSAAGWWLSGRL